jgi:hypothetical protein
MPSDLFNPALLRLLFRRGTVKRTGQFQWPRLGRFASGYGQFLVAAVMCVMPPVIPETECVPRRAPNVRTQDCTQTALT